MLSGENGCFLGDRPVTRAMNPLLTIWSNAQASDELQALDDADQVLLRRRLRPVTQPGKLRAVSVVSDCDQRLQLIDRPLFQSLDKILMRLLSGAGASRQADAFQNCRRRQQDAASSERFDHGRNDDVTAIRANRFGRRNLCDRPIITAVERTNAQI
jgi:hypothetical protein